jgi:deoxyadenosine/deoxycytidine kinase
MYNVKSRNRKIERALTRSYLEDLGEAYNHYFFRYDSTPLLIVNATELDFVNKDDDFDLLFKQIFREDRAYTEYFSPEAGKIE